MGERVIHTIAPVFDERSRVLVLGTMASPKSREAGFYYGHPQNRFWPVMAAVFNTLIYNTVDAKKAFLLERHIALWDVLHSCDITGAGDASIQNPVPNDLRVITEAANIAAVFATGSVAARLYEKYCYPQTGIHAAPLPSTSPANAIWTLKRLTAAYAAIREAVQSSGA